MMIFCTLFDSNYLSRGLAMYESLRAQTSDFRLYIFPFDDRSAGILRQLSLEHVVVVDMKDFEDSALLAVKPSRSSVEYCWTSTPSTIRYVLNKFNEPHCTYIDADLYFYGDPIALYNEMESRAVMITEHRFTPRYDLSALSGKYCVQYITFKNTADGIRALEWWRDACLDWCFAKEEEGKFGDQKYLDDWPERFPGVHVLQHLGGGVAPWNIQQYELTGRQNAIDGIEKSTGKKFQVIFYHFHYVRFYGGRTVDLGDYLLSPSVQRIMYHPYLRHIDEVVSRLNALDDSTDWYGNRIPDKGMNGYLVSFKRMLKRQYNVFPLIKYRKKYSLRS